MRANQQSTSDFKNVFTKVVGGIPKGAKRVGNDAIQ
jgi:hypothetical protein